MLPCDTIGIDASDPCTSGGGLQNFCECRTEEIRDRDSAGEFDRARCMMEHAWVRRCSTAGPMLVGMGFTVKNYKTFLGTWNFAACDQDDLQSLSCPLLSA